MNKPLWALACLFLVFSLNACSISGSLSPQSGQPDQPAPQKPVAGDRWPETGNYTYTFSGNGCSTGRQAFYHKSDYCTILTSERYNNSCALDLRKAAYTKNCGLDFELTSIPPARFTGFDTVLQKSCSTALAPVTYYDLAADYCQFLKNETLHTNCHWTERKTEFDRVGCRGGFSAPPAAAPTPTPNPTPTPQPSATPAPVDPRPAVIRDLEAAGIKVTIQYPQGPTDPNQQPFQIRLAAFYNVLAQAENTILARKAIFKQITLTDFASFHDQANSLILSVDLTYPELTGYLGLIDRRLAFEKNTGVNLELGIDIFNNEKGDKTKELAAKIAFFEQNAATLTSLRSMVKTITLETFTAYWLFSREMKLDRNNYDTAFKTLSQRLTALSPMFDLFDSNRIEVESTNSDTALDLLEAVMPKVMAAKQDIAHLAKISSLKKVSVQNDAQCRWYKSAEMLWIGSQNDCLSILPDIVKALVSQADKAQEKGIAIAPALDNLDKRFLESSKRLDARWSVIKGKKSIESVTLSDKSAFEYGNLTIGSDDTMADLDKVLKTIKD